MAKKTGKNPAPEDTAGPAGPEREPSAYELMAREAIRTWKNKDLNWFGKAMEIVNRPVDKAGDAVMKTPGVGWVIRKSVTGLLSIVNDVAQFSVPCEAICEEFRKQGHTGITHPCDFHTLDLEEIDRAIGWLPMKYKSAALLQGGTFGAGGALAIPPDIMLLVTLNLRAIGTFATYCGFDVSSPRERLFALSVLGLASSPTDASKTLAMAQLVRIAKEVARKRAWKQLEKHAFVRIVQRISKALGIRLTKAKLGQAVPWMGAAVGAGFNTYFTDKVCNAAYFLYRERFLAAKYGPEWIETTVEAADSYDPGFDEEEEELPSDDTEPEPPESD